MKKLTRVEHIEWSKKRALQYASSGELLNALTSISRDLLKHPQTQNHPTRELGIALYYTGKLSTPQQMTDFIEGIN